MSDAEVPMEQSESTAESVESQETETQEVPEEPTSQEDEQAQSSEEESGEDPAEAKEKRKNSFQERINEITRQRREAEERAKELEQRIQRYEGGEDAGPRPTLEQFDYDEQKHGEALDEWYAKRSAQAAREARRQEYEEEVQAYRERTQKATVETFKTRADEFAMEHPDFYETVQNPSYHQGPAIMQAVLQSENGPALAYHLGKNVALARELNSMPPVLAAMKLGQIEAKLQTPPAQQLTQSPKPQKPVGSKAPTVKDPDKMTPDEYRRARMAGKI